MFQRTCFERAGAGVCNGSLSVHPKHYFRNFKNVIPGKGSFFSRLIQALMNRFVALWNRQHLLIPGLVGILVFFSLCLKAQTGEKQVPYSFTLHTGLAEPETQRMPSFDLTLLRHEDELTDSYKGPYRFGFNHLVTIKPSLTGSWMGLPDGRRIWRLAIHSSGAQTLNLAFHLLDLPPGARIFVYSPDHRVVQGPFTTGNRTGDGETATDLIRGEDVIVEYDEPAGEPGKEPFEIFRVTHGYRSLNYARTFGQAGVCIPNVHCPEGLPWKTQCRSVICLVTGGNAFCSATLLNNTENDGTPYVLTANHCGTASGSWVFRFNWEAEACENPVSPPGETQFVSGASPIASNPASDFQLCLLNAPVPVSFHPFYAGWNATLLGADSVCAIHHPSGDVKKISLSGVPVTSQLWNGISVWKTGTWREGCTESGSSGSPLFDQQGRILGQLAGGPSACGTAIAQDYDYYGCLATSWNSGNKPEERLRDWLDPGNKGVLINSGFDPEQGVVSGQDKGIQFVLFPNPCEGTVSLLPGDQAGTPAFVRVSDVSGRLFLSQQGFDSSVMHMDLNTGSLAPGIYLVSLVTEKGTGVRKLIKK